MSLVLVNIFINYLGHRTEHILSEFADDTKVGEVVDMPESHAATQRNLKSLEKCSARNLMKFNKEKS